MAKTRRRNPHPYSEVEFILFIYLFVFINFFTVIYLRLFTFIFSALRFFLPIFGVLIIPTLLVGDLTCYSILSLRYVLVKLY